MDPPMLRLKKERRNYEMKTTVRYVYLSTLSLYRISRIMSSILLDFFRQKCYNFNFIYVHHQRLPPRHFVTMFAASNTRQKQGVTTRHTRRRYAAQSVTRLLALARLRGRLVTCCAFGSHDFRRFLIRQSLPSALCWSGMSFVRPVRAQLRCRTTKKGIRGGDAASLRPA